MGRRWGMVVVVGALLAGGGAAARADTLATPTVSAHATTWGPAGGQCPPGTDPPAGKCEILYDDAVVSGVAGGPAPTGTVTFELYGPFNQAYGSTQPALEAPLTPTPTCTETPVFSSTRAIDANGAVRSQAFVPNTAPDGIYVFRAYYSGDDAYAAAADPCRGPDQTVGVSAVTYARDPISHGPPPLPPAARRQAAKLQVTRVRLAGRVLDVLAPISAQASGTVAVTFRAAGRTERFTVPVDAGHRRVRFRRHVPAQLARAGTGIVTLRYAGDDDTLPETVRVRAARHSADLVSQRPTLVNGRLVAAGTIAKRAQGVVRLALRWWENGSEHTLSARLPIHHGRWSLDHRLTTDTAGSIARRAASLDAILAYTGDLRHRIRGAVDTFRVVPAD